MEKAQADVNYYQSVVSEKQSEAGRRNRLSNNTVISREALEQANKIVCR